MLRSLSLLMLLLMPLTALAQPALKQHEAEQRAREIFHSLRCVVCEGQSIADSQAQVAQDIRAVVRARVQKGESDESIRAFLVSRYGEQILMNPQLSAKTYLLWFGPLVILFLGAAIIFAYIGAGRVGKK